eukprot:g5454.t1
MVPSTARPASGRRRPRRVHTSSVLTVFAGALLASTPSSNAFQALTPALHTQAQPARTTATTHASHASADAAAGMQRQATPPRCGAPGAVCSGSAGGVSRTRGRRSVLLMSGGGAEDGGEGEALADGEELGVVVEGVASIKPSREAAREGERGPDAPPRSSGAVMSSTAGDENTAPAVDSTPAASEGAVAAAAAAAAAATKPKKAKKKTKTKGRVRIKAKAARLEGEALRDELMLREKREEARVLAVNTLFYRARAYNEIEDLERVWDKSELSECIRSIGGPLKGYDDIIEEYKTDFVLAQKQEKPGMRPFKVKNIKVQTCGTLAWVTCIEDMRSPYKPYPKTVQLVTNVFRKTRNGWRLTRHHASDRDVATAKSAGRKQTLKAARELPGGGSSLLHNFVDKTGGVTELSARLFRVVNGEMRPFDLDFHSSDDDDDDDDDDDSDEDEEDITDQIGREIASQIFLNYGDVFEDGKQGGEGITEIPLGEINFTSSGKAGNGDSLDETIPPAMRKRIEEALEAKLKNRRGEANQRFQNIYNLNEGLKEVTRDAEAASSAGNEKDDDDKDSEWGDLGASGKEWSSTSSSGGTGEKGEEEDRERGGVATRESRDLTRKTVDAVRILADMGRISDREKGVLLADVIRNASSAGPSVTEAAYSLLLDGDVTPEGMEYTHKADEFAEQCKAITLQLEKQMSSRWWKFWARPQWWRFWPTGQE